MFYLFFYGPWLSSTFWLLGIMLLWICKCKYLFETLLSIWGDIYPEVELMSHISILFLNFCGTNIQFSIEAIPFYIPKIVQGFQFLYILTNTCYFLVLLLLLIVGVLMGVRWVFICLSLWLVHCVEHLFMWLLAICTSSLDECLFKYFSHWKMCCSFFCHCSYLYLSSSYHRFHCFAPLLKTGL